MLRQVGWMWRRQPDVQLSKPCVQIHQRDLLRHRRHCANWHLERRGNQLDLSLLGHCRLRARVLAWLLSKVLIIATPQYHKFFHQKEFRIWFSVTSMVTPAPSSSWSGLQCHSLFSVVSCVDSASAFSASSVASHAKKLTRTRLFDHAGSKAHHLE